MSQIVETDGNAERYVIQERIAGGGMGRIYRGVKKGIGGFEKPVVLKQLLPELASNPELVDLFFREAHIHAALEHANIVHIIDLVVSGNDYFIVLEYVRGTDLYRVIKHLRKHSQLLPVPAALYIARELFKALDYAHSKTDEDGRPLGIVHRDISPTNILLSAAGEVKITDFGIARSASDSSGFINVRGKLSYMSPEQAMGKPLDHRTDLYSAAVCTYEMLAGHRPLPSIKNLVDAAFHFDQPIKPLTKVRPTCPRELDDILAQMLSPEPELRPDSAGQILAVLERITNENQLFFSARRLADYLTEILGPDPATWSDTKDYASAGSRSGGIQRQATPRQAKGGAQRGVIGMELTSMHLKRGLQRRGLPSPKGSDPAASPQPPPPVSPEGAVLAAAMRRDPPLPPPPAPPGPPLAVTPGGATVPRAQPQPPNRRATQTPNQPPGGATVPPPPHPSSVRQGLPPAPPPAWHDQTESRSSWITKTALALGLTAIGLLVFWMVVVLAGL